MSVSISRLVPILCPLFVVLVRAAVCQGRPVSPSRGAYADSCLAPSEFQLGGAAIDADAEGVVERLGKALRVRRTSGEDDGGRYERLTYYYRPLELDVVRGMLSRIATHVPSTATPSGLHPGLERDSVRRILLSSGVTFKADADELLIEECSSGGVAGHLMVLTFDRKGRVLGISMSGDTE